MGNSRVQVDDYDAITEWLVKNTAEPKGTLGFFPWCAGLVLDGKSKDKITRNINRVSVLLLFLCIVAASGIVTARYTVKDNMFCGQCDNLCARVCADCGTCIG